MLYITHPHGIKDGRDARCTNFCIMGQQGGQFTPMHFRAGDEVAFEVIGVNFNKAWHQVVVF